MFFAEDRDRESCVNKQKSNMQNFYDNNNAAAQSRKAPVTYVGNSCEDNLENVKTGGTEHFEEFRNFKRSENFIIDVHDEHSTVHDFISKITDFIKTKFSEKHSEKEITGKDAIGAIGSADIKEFQFDNDMLKKIFSYIAALFMGWGSVLLEIVKLPFRKRARVKIIAGGTTLVFVFAICMTANAAGYKLGYEVSVGGEAIGTVVRQDDAIEAVNSANETISQCSGEERVEEPVFSRTIVAPDSAVSSKELEETILSNVDSMIECPTIFIDGKAAVGFKSREDAETVITKYKEKYSPEHISDDTVVEFCEDIEIRDSYVSYAMIKDVDEAIATLSENVENTKYVIGNNDTLWDIAKNNGTTVEKIKSLNNGLTDVIHGGEVINIKAPRPLVSVRTVETKEYTEEIPFNTKTVYSDELYVGESKITTEGGEGKAVAVARVTSINGVEENRKVIERTVTVEPITRVKTIGTKEKPKTVATGSFGKPTSTGTLSSTFGARWGRRHNGIDISLAVNNNVYAADGGVVTYSGWMSGYGNYIIIDHQNGYQTCYGHNNKVLVSKGQKVAKGDKIALSGNTGNSTGPHLHFEVKKNGAFQNPLNYVKY